MVVDGQSIDINASVGVAGLQYTLVDLLPSSSHVFAVAAINALGEGAMSDNATFR